MPVFDGGFLRDLAADIFLALGAPRDEAELVADSLVQSNLMGHDSHGIIRVLRYLKFIREGWICPGAPITIVEETDTTAVVDGGWGFGQVVAKRAMEVCIRKAKEKGLASVVVRRCNHVGRVGAYPQMAAEQGLIGMAMVNACGAAQYMPPFGGIQGRLATNPIAVAIPTGGHPILVDMTTSVVAEGKIRVKLHRGEPLPEGWIIDAEGEPSTNPKDFYGPPPGAILPLGGVQFGHKGFALALVVEILSGILSGAGYVREDAKRIGNGVWMLALNIENFFDLQTFKEQVDELVRYLKTSRLAPGFSEILMPGELEFREIERRKRDGIFVEEETWRQLQAVAAELGVSIQCEMRKAECEI